jgi:hypothetical protein
MVGSNQKRNAELRTDSTQILDSELSVSVRLSEVSEECLEAGWREHFEDATSARHHAPVSMGHSSWAKDDVTWPRLDFRATDSEDVFTLKDVEELIVTVVNVSRRVERMELFDDRERTSS